MSFNYPSIGGMEFKGTYKGLGVTEVADPPNIDDPMTLVKTYSPDKPPNPADKFSGDPAGELADAVTAANTKYQIPGGGWFSFIQLFGDDEKDQNPYDAFVEQWNQSVEKAKNATQ